ncbi:bacteriohemerythrin [Leptospira idonii]|uniref:Hemerythrin-like domain-containing protein n=1 Tax=Leptospira idonii TaxID=1193500 RepID=A0A4R9LVY0_9LEPT|nr:bacteriohemerythrin [Leptospira idonii]TGN18423.1 hypothetical protein EHS15_13585 [Leptospira idonii]
MKTVKWEKKFETGIPTIDRQHQQLFDLTGELIKATEEGKGRRIIVDVLKNLIHYTQTHFVDEERIMKEIHYPHYEIHKKEHENFIQEVLVSTKELIEGRSMPTLKLTNFLSQWLIEHVLIHDSQIGEFAHHSQVERK